MDARRTGLPIALAGRRFFAMFRQNRIGMFSTAMSFS